MEPTSFNSSWLAFRTACEASQKPTPPISEQQEKFLESIIVKIVNYLSEDRVFECIKENGRLIARFGVVHGNPLQNFRMLFSLPEIADLSFDTSSVLKQRLKKLVNPERITLDSTSVELNVCNIKRLILLDHRGLAHEVDSDTYHLHTNPKNELQVKFNKALNSYRAKVEISKIEQVIKEISEYAKNLKFLEKIETRHPCSKVYFELNFNEYVTSAQDTELNIKLTKCFMNFSFLEIAVTLQRIRELNLFPLINPKCFYQEVQGSQWKSFHTTFETYRSIYVKITYRLYHPTKGPKLA